jgi:hypothetical protein
MRCSIAFAGLRVDDAIEQALLPVLEPGAIAAAVDEKAQLRGRQDQSDGDAARLNLNQPQRDLVLPIGLNAHGGPEGMAFAA